MRLQWRRPWFEPESGRSTGEGIVYPLQYSWASLVAQLLKNHLQCGRTGFNPWVGKIPWRRKRLPTPVFLDFPCGMADKESACNTGDVSLIPGSRRSPGEGNGNPLQYFCLENPMDRGVWWDTAHEVARVEHNLVLNKDDQCHVFH